MDEVTSKLKKLFKSKPKTFKGQGQKLGAAPQVTSSPGRGAFRERQTPIRKPATSANVPDKPSPPVSARPLGLKDVPATQSSYVPPASVMTTGAYIVPEEHKPTPEQEAAYKMLSSDPQRKAAAEVLSKVLRNIIEHPTEAKYRKLKMNNKKVQDTVVNVDGGLELLQACGFALMFEEGTPEPQSQESETVAQSSQSSPNMETSTTGYLWFPEEAELWLLEAALQLLRPLVPLPFAKSSSQALTQNSSQFLTQVSPSGRPSSDQQTSSSSSSATALSQQPGGLSRPSSASRDLPSAASGGSAASTSFPSASTPNQVPASSTAASTSFPSASTPNQVPASSTAGTGNPSHGNDSSVGLAPSSTVTSTSRSVNLSEPRKRKTQVLLPTEPDAQVTDSVFDRSPLELKQAFTAAKKRRETESMLMTRAYREKLANKQPNTNHMFAVIRVRLPEGLLLQGEFNAREAVSAIFEWVSDSLRDPDTTYELILPSRKPLSPAMGRVTDADLLPSALLNLRIAGGRQQGPLPTLNDDLLRRIQ